jgi:cbb3-type cytochrome oxidase cytochrome c subunit
MWGGMGWSREPLRGLGKPLRGQEKALRGLQNTPKSKPLRSKRVTSQRFGKWTPKPHICCKTQLKRKNRPASKRSGPDLSEVGARFLEVTKKEPKANL